MVDTDVVVAAISNLRAPYDDTRNGSDETNVERHDLVHSCG